MPSLVPFAPFTREESQVVTAALMSVASSSFCDAERENAVRTVLNIRNLSTLSGQQLAAMESESFQSVFHTWFFFFRPYLGEGTFADAFLVHKTIPLPKGCKRYIDAMKASRLRPYEITEVRFDEGFTLRDLWSDEVVHVSERRATHYAKRLDTIFARIVVGPGGTHEIHGLLNFPRAQMRELARRVRDAADPVPEIMTEWIGVFAPLRAKPRGRTTAVATTQRIVQLKISLRDIKPPIWRRILVPENIPLVKLSRTIERAMGWSGYHLHAFRLGRLEYGVLDPDYPTDMMSERGKKLSDLGLGEGESFDYDYDFGDGWQHRVVAEKFLDRAPGAKYPTCVAGRRACPPEDVGGTGGYENLVEVLRDPDHCDYKRLRTWSETYTGHYDPAAFELAETDKYLRR